MSERFCVVADHAHLRFFRQRQEAGQREAMLEEVQAMDFPLGRQSYTARDTSMAGRFQGSPSRAGNTPAGAGPAGRAGMSIDERLPMQREDERRRARDVAHEIETFFAGRNDCTWDLAIAPALHHAVLEQLTDSVRKELERVIAKDLVNQPAEDVRAHFASAH